MSYENIEMIKAQVKWYSEEKGYGFVNHGDESPDIFMHFSILDSIGIKCLHPGDNIVCDISEGYNGYQVIKIYEVKFDHQFYKNEFDPSEIYETTGELKWYNTHKGYGFIYGDEDNSQIFFHYSIIDPNVISFLKPGIRLNVKYFLGEKGKEAKEISFI